MGKRARRPSLARRGRWLRLPSGALATASRSRSKAIASQAVAGLTIRWRRARPAAWFRLQQADQPGGRVGDVDFVGAEATHPAVGAVPADGRGERDVAAGGSDVQA